MGLCDFCKPFRQHLSNLSVILLSRALGWDWTGVAGVAERTTFLVRGAPVRLRPLAGAAGAPVFSEVPHSPQNFILSGFSVPQLVQRMLPLYPFRHSRTRETSGKHGLTITGCLRDNPVMPEDSASTKLAETRRLAAIMLTDIVGFR